MKKIVKTIAILVTVILFNACSSDGNGNGNSFIYQKWYCTEVIQDGNSQLYNSNNCRGFYMEFYDVNKFRIVGTDFCHEEILSEGTFTNQVNTIITNGTNLTNHTSFTSTYEVTELTQYKLTMRDANYYYVSNTGELLPGLILKYNP